MGIDGVDMNDEENLSLYREILGFKNDFWRDILHFSNPDYTTQRAVQSIAHSLELEYEFSLATAEARITRRTHFNYEKPAISAETWNLNEPGHIPLNDSISLNDATEIETADFNSWLQDPSQLIEIAQAAEQYGVTGQIEPEHSQQQYSKNFGLNDHQGVNIPLGIRIPSSPLSLTVNSHHISHIDIASKSNETPNRRASSISSRVSSRVIRALGACWRCKVLRDKCDPKTPCAMCSKSLGSRIRGLDWLSVGCRRGGIKRQMAPIEICPQDNPRDRSRPLPESALYSNSTSSPISADGVNDLMRHNLLEREKALRSGAPIITIFENKIGDIDALLQKYEDSWPGLSTKFQTEQFSLPRLPPLDDCVTSITWEVITLPALNLLKDGNIMKFRVLLRSASLYQARSDKSLQDELISQSLLCLRTCLEVLRLTTAEKLTLQSHQLCMERGTCQLECISNLVLYLNKFLDELSRVFFQKEDMRSKAWWIPIFYSFCIQAVVRKALISITKKPWANEYLYLAIRLFIATSATYDPVAGVLVAEDSSSPEDLQTLEEYSTIRSAIGVPSNDFSGSGNYLKEIFEDSGGPINYDWIAERPLSPSCIDIESTSPYRAHESSPMSFSRSPYATYSPRSDNYAPSFANSNSSYGSISMSSFTIDRTSSDNFDSYDGLQGFICTFPGCESLPFQTQYLLDDHVIASHTTDRPHFCSVPKCPRSQGGKGFKRKNELIRHGLVHDSPGYICPFCPDREHKYPRPDNLRRHVRVHHPDKNDDPCLIDVLSRTERPRGRRRKNRP